MGAPPRVNCMISIPLGTPLETFLRILARFGDLGIHQSGIWSEIGAKNGISEFIVPDFCGAPKPS